MDRKAETCCFTGHRELLPDAISAIRERLDAVIGRLYAEGVRCFGAGGAIGFDMLAEEAVLSARKKYPGISLILVLPCRNQTRGWSLGNIARYQAILAAADKVVYTSERYSPGCMQKRNRHLVDHSAYCVTYLTDTRGGTAYTVSYARSSGTTVINLAEP